jgi:hypothetical protein
MILLLYAMSSSIPRYQARSSQPESLVYGHFSGLKEPRVLEYIDDFDGRNIIKIILKYR